MKRWIFSVALCLCVCLLLGGLIGWADATGAIASSVVQSIYNNGSHSLSYHISEDVAYHVGPNYVEAYSEPIAKTPEVLFEQDFETEQFPPEGWELDGGEKTWKRYSYYYLNKTQAAYVSYDEGTNQNERLIAPAVNLMGATDTNLEFDYAFSYYAVKRGEMTFTVEASIDGGSTWTTLWNAKDAIGDSASSYVPSDRAFVTIPAALCTGNTLISWHYVKPAGEDYSGIAAIDNVKIEASYTMITATAGEGGAITPSGRTYVKEGKSQTYTITPLLGYEISDVLVDGVSIGAMANYSFENVTESHTIEAHFKASSDIPSIYFENDFEDTDFPARGWSVASKATSSMTWEKGSLTNLNNTSVAVVTNDYENWSNSNKQDEYLITPAVDLNGKKAVLTFDFAFGRYAITSGQMKLTVEASTDGGETWDTIWNAADIPNLSGWYYSGSAEVTVPTLYCKENVRFAFHYTRSKDSAGDKAAIDNIALKDLIANRNHPETELRNVKSVTCTIDGYTGDTYCKNCSALLKVGTVVPTTGHAIVIDAAVPATCTEPGKTEVNIAPSATTRLRKKPFRSSDTT